MAGRRHADAPPGDRRPAGARNTAAWTWWTRCTRRCGARALQRPTFSEEVEVVSQRLVGEKHLALKLKHRGEPVDAIWFGHRTLPARVTLAFRLDADEWQGQRRVRFLVRGCNPRHRRR